MKWVRIVADSFKKMPEIYQKILEKREMSFRSLKNKNWTFRGSFDNLLAFFRYFLGFLIHPIVFIREVAINSIKNEQGECNCSFFMKRRIGVNYFLVVNNNFNKIFPIYRDSVRLNLSLFLPLYLTTYDVKKIIFFFIFFFIL